MLTAGTDNNSGTPTQFCSSAGSDSDGDGFGFENNQSCIVKTDTNFANTDLTDDKNSNDVLVGGSGSVFGSAGRFDLLLLMMMFVAVGFSKARRHSL